MKYKKPKRVNWKKTVEQLERDNDSLRKQVGRLEKANDAIQAIAEIVFERMDLDVRVRDAVQDEILNLDISIS